MKLCLQAKQSFRYELKNAVESKICLKNGKNENIIRGIRKWKVNTYRDEWDIIVLRFFHSFIIGPASDAN